MADTKQNPTFKGDAFVSWREFLSSAYTPALALVCLSVWLHAADSLIVATMLPSVVAEIGGAVLVGWSVSLYEIASVVAGAASALLTIRYGLRMPMCLAALVFGFGCFLSVVAPSMPLLLAGRVFQGLGGGGLVAMGFVAVGVIFPRRYTARAMAAVSTFWGVSAFLGPLIGGFFVEFATWRWGFAFFGGQAIALALWIALRPDHAPSDARVRTVFPWRRLALLCLSVLLVSYGGVEIKPMQTTLCVLSGGSCLILFLRLDHRAQDDRLLPLRPFDLTKPTGSALLMILSLSLATIAITAFGPLLVVVIHNTSALTAGYIVACSSIGWTVTAVLFSGSPERLDRSQSGWRSWPRASSGFSTPFLTGRSGSSPCSQRWKVRDSGWRGHSSSDEPPPLLIRKKCSGSPGRSLPFSASAMPWALPALGLSRMRLVSQRWIRRHRR